MGRLSIFIGIVLQAFVFYINPILDFTSLTIEAYIVLGLQAVNTVVGLYLLVSSYVLMPYLVKMLYVVAHIILVFIATMNVLVSFESGYLDVQLTLQIFYVFAPSLFVTSGVIYLLNYIEDPVVP